MSSPMPDLSPIGNEATAMSYAELRARAQITSGMLKMGEPIAFGSDAAIIDELCTAIETLERERDEARREVDHLSDQVTELQYQPWPQWATAVLNAIRKRSGYDGYDDATDGVDLPQELEETFAELEREAERHTHEVRADREVERHKQEADHYRKQAAEQRARAEAAEAQVAKLKEALEPFAGIGELVEVETEGFSDSDEFELLFGDDLRFDRIAVGKFRRAREALKDTSP